MRDKSPAERLQDFIKTQRTENIAKAIGTYLDIGEKKPRFPRGKPTKAQRRKRML